MFILHHDHRSQGATAHAGDRIQGVLHVRRVLAVLDAKPRLQRLGEALGAAHVTGGAVAHLDDLLAHRVEPELGVESDHSVELRLGHLRGRRDTFDHLEGHMSEFFLDSLQDRDCLGWIHALVCHDGVY
jgi:hypothetical protein